MNYDNNLAVIESKKLHELSHVEVGFVELRLTEVCKLIGIQQAKDRELMQQISALIPMYYPHLNLNDIGKAFLDNVAGKLSDKPIEMYYNSFDWTFAAKVLTAYVKHQQTLKAQPPRPTEASHQLEAASDESRWRADYISMLEWIQQEEGKVPSMGNFWQCFMYLKLIGRINPNVDEYKFTVHIAKQWIDQEVEKMNYPNEKRDFRNMYESKTDRFINKCREIYFRDWIEDQMQSSGDRMKWLDQELKSA